MHAKAQLSRSDLPINIEKKARRKTSRASFSPRDVAHGMTPEVKDILEVLKTMQVMIPETTEVGEYLLAHSDLSRLISQICGKLIKMFAEDAKLFLEIYRDPEIHDEYLTLYIRKKEYEEMILDRIDEAMSEFEPALGSASGWLLVTTDFLLPK
jgi:hypothetical protein